MLHVIEDLHKKLGISYEKFLQIKQEYPEVIKRLEKMQEYEKVFVSIGKENILTQAINCHSSYRKLKLFGETRKLETRFYKVDTYEKYDENMTKLEFDIDHINSSGGAPYIRANHRSVIKFMQDLHPHFRIQRLYKYDKYKKPTIEVKVRYDELEDGKKYVYTEDGKKIELTPKLELQIKTLMKASFTQQDLLEMIFDFQVDSGFGGYEDDFKEDEEDAIEESRRMQIRALYKRVSSHMSIPPFENLDKGNKKRVLKYMRKTKCSLEEAMFSVFC